MSGTKMPAVLAERCYLCDKLIRAGKGVKDAHGLWYCNTRHRAQSPAAQIPVEEAR